MAITQAKYIKESIFLYLYNVKFEGNINTNFDVFLVYGNENIEANSWSAI